MLAAAGLYLAAALATRFAETTGFARFTCACEPDCWCKRPGPSLLRWVTPRGLHRLGTSAEEKARCDENR